MQVKCKRSVIYNGKLHRAGEVVEVEAVDASRDFFTIDEVVPDVIDEPSEPVKLPPLKKK